MVCVGSANFEALPAKVSSNRHFVTTRKTAQSTGSTVIEQDAQESRAFLRSSILLSRPLL
jgi:hypothetical protein